MIEDGLAAVAIAVMIGHDHCLAGTPAAAATSRASPRETASRSTATSAPPVSCSSAVRLLGSPPRSAG